MFAMAPKLAMITFCLCMLAMAGGARCSESVTITNMLTEPLRVYCHSRDDSLAVQMLAPTQVYVIHFNKSLWGTTLFTCDFNAAGFGYAGIKVWEGFNYAHRKITCTQCRWDVTPLGFKCNGSLIYSWP